MGRCGGGWHSGKNWAFLAPHLSRYEATIFDLRSWKLRPRRWAHLPADVQHAIASFDLLIVPAPGPASNFLPGRAAPKALAP